MKNQAPIKRHQAIVSFSKDHHFGLLLIWKIRQGLNKAVNPERISNYVTFFFKEDLEKHFKEEEQLLFSKLPADDVLRKQAEGDHQAIYKLVAAIEKKKDDAVLLNQLADELEKHIRFEERELFNHLQDNIKADDLEAIANRFPNSSKAIDEKWEDVFGKLKNNKMDIPDKYGNQKRVVIVGAGFAGLTLAKKLSLKYFQVILIDKNNYHQFQPLLYQVATSGLEPSSISFPLRKIFQQKRNIFIRMTQVNAVSPETKMVHTDIGDVEYDYLVLAQGATTNYFNNDQLQKNAYSMKSVSEALLLRNTLLQNYELALNAENKEQRSSLLNVVIVGGGPTGVELAGAIAEMKKKILPKDYVEINFGHMHIHLLEAAPRLLNGMSSQSGNTVVEYLNGLGVEVQTNTAVKDYDGETISLSNGKTIHSRCLIWAAGVKGVSIPGIPTGSAAANNRILVNQYNLVKDLPRVYAIGDIALMQDKLLPKGHPQVAQVAIQQARLLAKNLQKIESGKPLIAFQYKDKGSLATVGRNLALAEIGKLKLKGFVAWFVWMLVHLMSIIGIKNRLFVLINWMWQYITYDQSLRLIIRPSDKKMKSNYMKQILTILLAANLLLACNAGNEKEKTTTTAPAAETHADHGEQATELALNNGEKWKADSTTLQNVALLQKIVSGTKQENLENHLKIAASLQDDLNKMVSECKMKGADHEALHHWLEPIMEKTKELKNANSIETARTIFGEIEKQLNLFPQYFE